MLFDVAGPFKVKRYGKKKLITKQSLTELKQELEEWESGLCDACGCYVFAIRAGKGYTPYYVGQACKRAILDEALNPSNRGKYNEVCSETNGMPVLFFLPMRTPTRRFRKKGSGRLPAIDFLERWLIAQAIDKNSRLINNKETRFLRKIHVVGVFNAGQGEATSDSACLHKALR